MIRDMTYCSNTKCEQICPRNQNLIANKEKYIWIGNFEECEFFKKVDEDNE